MISHSDIERQRCDMSPKVFVFRNNKALSIKTYEKVVALLEKKGFTIIKEYDKSVDLLICIGGDGTFLSFIHKLNFPKAPIIGINTGHLGFFQEASPQDIDVMLDNFLSKNYKLYKIKTIEAHISTERGNFTRNAINEFLLRGPFSHVSQFSVSIENTKIQDFSGDGILISTPAGSTAYNYSLGGSLLAPELDVLQITPVAPMNTNAYRCFHSSIVLPAKETITVEGIGRSSNGTVVLSFDGKTHEFNNVKSIEIVQSHKQLSIIRAPGYDYWSKLKAKLI